MKKKSKKQNRSVAQKRFSRGKSEEKFRSKGFLKGQYLGFRKSLEEIANECNCSSETVRRWLRRFQIPIRSYPEFTFSRNLHVALEVELLEVLNGLLLGDGHLNRNKWSSSYQHGSKFKGPLKWLSRKLERLGIEQVGRIRRRETTLAGYPDKKHTYFDYSSRSYVELKALQTKWYRPATEKEKAKGRRFFKIVPIDLILTPITCLHWYIGDGYLGSSTHRGIGLSTQCFERAEVDFLVTSLTDLGFKATQGKEKTIRIWTQSKLDFLDFIGPCPIEVKNFFGYKWGVI